MPICSYLVIPDEGATDRVYDRLAVISGCNVVRAKGRDVLILVTDTSGLDEENRLRSRVEAIEGIQALLLTFGEIESNPRSTDERP